MVNVPGQLGRGLLFVLTTTIVVISLSLLPITTVTALGFTSPIWVAILAGPLLGEKVTMRQWIAIIGGFVGVLMIVQPGTEAFTWVLLLPALLAVVSACRDVLTSYLSRTDTSIGILFWSSLIVIAFSALTVPWAHASISTTDAGWYVLNGLLSALAHFCMILAYRLADAAMVSTFRYTGQIWAIIFGALIWHHFPDTLSLIGSAIIIGSGIVMLERGKAAKGPVAAAASPTRST
jgi:drug/metabolite transporter (DMT)-like permease